MKYIISGFLQSGQELEVLAGWMHFSMHVPECLGDIFSKSQIFFKPN